MQDDVRRMNHRTMAVFDGADGNGIPDSFDGSGQTSIVINAQPYQNLAKTPGEVRAISNKAMGGFQRGARSDDAPRIEINAVMHYAVASDPLFG